MAKQFLVHQPNYNGHAVDCIMGDDDQRFGNPKFGYQNLGEVRKLKGPRVAHPHNGIKCSLFEHVESGKTYGMFVDGTAREVTK